jgi:MscS family membrane protein
MTKKRFFFLLLFIFSGLIVDAQTDSPAESNLSPYHTIYNHLYYLQPDSYDVLQAARSLSVTSPEEFSDASIKLKEILDGRGLYIDINRLPDNNNYYDTLRREFIYVLSKNEPRIYVEKQGDNWLYSKTTVAEIDRMYKEIYPLNGALRALFKGPQWQNSFFGIKTWQWLSFFLLIGLSFVFYMLVFFILRRIGHKLAHIKRSEANMISGSISKLTRLASLLLTLILFEVFIPALHLTPVINSFLVKGLEILHIFFIILIISEIAHLVFSYLKRWAATTESTMDDQLMPMLSRIVDIIIWVIGVIYILDFLEINVTALLAGISIGGLAIALAAQDTVKNFFGSNGIDGVVERVGVRSTRLRSFANSLTYVPNGVFAETVIDNMGLRVYRRYKTEIGITYDTPTYLIDLFVNGIENLIESHPFTRKDNYEVALSNFGDSGIQIMIYAFFAVDNWTDEVRGKHDIMKGIINLADAIGVRFAFPTQTIFVEEMPGKPSLTPTKLTRDTAEENANIALKKIKSEFVNSQADIEREKNIGGA